MTEIHRGAPPHTTSGKNRSALVAAMVGEKSRQFLQRAAMLALQALY